MKDTAEVYFRLKGYFNPEEIIKQINLNPTDILNTGFLTPTKLPNESFWVYGTGRIINDCLDIGELSRTLINDLKPYLNELKELIEQFKLTPCLKVILSLSMQDSSTPTIGFDKEVLNFLASLDASIEQDIYKN